MMRKKEAIPNSAAALHEVLSKGFSAPVIWRIAKALHTEESLSWEEVGSTEDWENVILAQHFVMSMVRQKLPEGKTLLSLMQELGLSKELFNRYATLWNSNATIDEMGRGNWSSIDFFKRVDELFGVGGTRSTRNG